MATLHCEVLTPTGSAFSGEASFVEAHALDGRLGILPSHAPLITALGKGPLRVKLADSTEKKWTIDGGFLEVLDNVVSITAEGLEDAS